MGVEELEKIVQRFMVSGWFAETPIAVIENGWSPEQRTTIGTLSTISGLKTSIGFKSPAVIVIGEVVKFRAEFGEQHDL
jgi:uroporphyrin-III C-methyltransferase/precorrin-2 dehydrogenase/sirohydrochlorin ferrochelatase